MSASDIGPATSHDLWKTTPPADRTPDDLYDLAQRFAALPAGVTLSDIVRDYRGQWPSELIARVDVELEVSTDTPATDLCRGLLKLIAEIVTEVGIEDGQELIECLSAVELRVRKGGAQ